MQYSKLRIIVKVLLPVQVYGRMAKLAELYVNDGRVVELAYTYASGAYGSNPVRVQVPPRPPFI